MADVGVQPAIEFRGLRRRRRRRRRAPPASGCASSLDLVLVALTTADPRAARASARTRASGARRSGESASAALHRRMPLARCCSTVFSEMLSSAAISFCDRPYTLRSVNTWRQRVGRLRDGAREQRELLVRVHDLVDLAALVEQLQRLEIGDQLDGHHLAVTQPGQRDVARDRERERADRADFLAALARRRPRAGARRFPAAVRRRRRSCARSDAGRRAGPPRIRAKRPGSGLPSGSLRPMVHVLRGQANTLGDR